VFLVYHIPWNLLDVFKDIDMFCGIGHVEGIVKTPEEFLQDFFG